MAPIIEIFCLIDDFCKRFETASKQRLLPNPNRQRNKACSLSLSEIMTIIICFQLSHYRTFKDFYLNYACVYLKEYFPKLVSYNRFVELMPYAITPFLVLLHKCKGKETGKYYVDSTQLAVCHNLRISRYKVFKNLARRGKTSTGWFFGFKLHLIFNDLGELMRFKLTSANVDDRAVLEELTKNLKGWLFGDKGYLSKELEALLLKKGIELFTRVRRNMKQKIITAAQKAYLNKRGIIETIIDQLKSICYLQHTRHRSSSNFLVNLLAALFAYILKPNKISLKFNLLMSN
jgi:hypothetical protein